MTSLHGDLIERESMGMRKYAPAVEVIAAKFGGIAEEIAREKTSTIDHWCQAVLGRRT